MDLSYPWLQAFLSYSRLWSTENINVKAILAMTKLSHVSRITEVNFSSLANLPPRLICDTAVKDLHSLRTLGIYDCEFFNMDVVGYSVNIQNIASTILNYLKSMPSNTESDDPQMRTLDRKVDNLPQEFRDMVADHLWDSQCTTVSKLSIYTHSCILIAKRRARTRKRWMTAWRKK